MQDQLNFLPGLFQLALVILAVVLFVGLWEFLDQLAVSHRRRKRDRAANSVLEVKRHDHRDHEYLKQVEADLRLHGVPIDSGFLANLSGDKYVS